MWTTCRQRADDVRMTCRWHADDVWMTWEWYFGWDFTGGWHMSSAHRPHVIQTLAWVAQFHGVLHLVSSAHHPHIHRHTCCLHVIHTSSAHTCHPHVICTLPWVAQFPAVLCLVSSACHLQTHMSSACHLHIICRYIHHLHSPHGPQLYFLCQRY